MRRSIVAMTAAGVVTAVLLGGCSSTKSGKASSGVDSAVATSKSASTSAPAAPVDLKAQLLTAGDLPTGWALDNSADNSDDTTPPCLADVKTKVEPATKADQDFVKGTDFPALSQHIGDFGSSASAGSTFTQLTGILNACKDVSFTSSGTKITGTIGALSLPTLGEQSNAWQMVLSAQGQTLAIDLVLVQKGRELELLLYGDYGTPSMAEFTTLANKAIGKVPAS